MPQVDSQIMRALLGGTFVPGVDAQAEQSNWLDLEAKRRALQRQPRIDALNEANIKSEIENRNTDNRLNQAAYDQNAANTAALRKKETDALAATAKKEAEEKDRMRHASAAIALHEDQSDERLAALVAQGSLNPDEQAAFAAIPLEKRKAEARSLMFKNMTPTEIEAYDTKQSTIANQGSEIAKRTADTDAAKATKAQADEAYGLWAEQNTLPRNALTRLQFDRMPKETAQSAPNTPAELAIIASDPNQPAPKRAAANEALKRLNEYQRNGRTVINNNHAPGLGGPTNPTTQNMTGDAYLKTLPPSTAAAVRAIASGNDVMPAANARSQAAQDIRNAVYQYDPNFNVQRAQVRKAFTTGPDARNIGALNTAIVHLGRLDEVADSLSNGSFVPGNEAYNWLRDKFGSEKVTNFTLLKDAVAGEMAAALKGNATDIEISKMGQSIRAANSPGQMKGIVAEGMSILDDKAQTYNERYHAVAPDDPWSPVLPRAAAAMAKRNVGGGGSKTVRMRAPNGQEQDVPADQVGHFESKGAKRVK